MEETQSLKVPETYRSELRVDVWPPLFPLLGPVVGVALVLALLCLLAARTTGRPLLLRLAWACFSLAVGAGVVLLLA